MSSGSRRVQWLLLGIAAAVLLAGAAAARISSSAAVVPLKLAVGASATLSVFRVLPDTVRLSLDFDRRDGLQRPELGESRSTSGPGYLEFASPGEPIVIRVRGPSSTADFEALPASGSGANRVHRHLVIRTADGDPRRFPWPPDNSARPALPVGTSTITIEVLKVGAPLAGEKVAAVFKAPLSFKEYMPGYGFLWWFLLWPAWAAPLVACAAFLAYRSRDSWRVWRAPPQRNP